MNLDHFMISVQKWIKMFLLWLYELQYQEIEAEWDEEDSFDIKTTGDNEDA